MTDASSVEMTLCSVEGSFVSHQSAPLAFWSKLASGSNLAETASVVAPLSRANGNLATSNWPG